MENFKDEIVQQHEAVVKSWKKFEKNMSAEWGLSGVDTGHHYLNLTTGGWSPGKLTTIAARSGVGKTALTTQMFQSGARVLQGRRPEYLFFTWEMSPDYLVDRHISHEVGLNYKQLTQGARLLPTSTVEKIKAHYKTADSLPVSYQQISLNISDVMVMSKQFVEMCEEKSQVEGVAIQPVIIIDFIGMAQFDKFGPRTYGISEFIYGCKQVASQTGASFCVFSQINRSSDLKERPNRADISDSQAIEQASDHLILLHRPEHHRVRTMRDPVTGEDMSTEGKMVVIVEKNRDGELQDYIVNADVQYYRFWSEGQRWNEPYWEQYESAEFWMNHFNLGNESQLKVVV
jgi:replicative DNA helicase